MQMGRCGKLIAKLELEVVLQDVTRLEMRNPLAVRKKRIKIRKEDDSKMSVEIDDVEKGGDKCWEMGR